MAPTPAWAPASGWWSRPTRATAPSSSCRRTSPSSPTSIPSISTTTAPSTRSAQPFRQFVENVPFYGFAVCASTIPRCRRWSPGSRIAASSPMAATRRPTSASTTSASRAGARRFQVVIRDRVTGGETASRRSRCRCPATTTCRTPRPRLPSPIELGISAEAIRKGLAGFGGVKRRFTATGTWNGVSIYDDYGHHPVEIAAVLKAARGGATGRVIAIVQPHRYTRLASLFDDFCNLLQRRRHGPRRGGLSGGRAADRRRRPRSSRRRRPRRRPSRRPPAVGPEGARPADPRHRPPGRHGRLPRRRQHHPMGLRAAGGAGGAGCGGRAMRGNLRSMPEWGAPDDRPPRTPRRPVRHPRSAGAVSGR